MLIRMYNWIDRVMLGVENSAGWDVDLRMFISCRQGGESAVPKK